MKIVIDISNEGYDWIKNGFPDDEDKEFLIKAVKNGTVIPPTVKPKKAKVGELIDAYTKGFDTGVEIARSARLKGEWIKATNEFLNWECSFCHQPHDFRDNFCPKCGADMRKGGAE